MKRNRLLPILTLLILTFALSACGSQTFASWPGITVNEEQVYLAFNQYVYAIRLENGEQAWRFPKDKPEDNTTFYAPPALTPEGKIIVGSYTQGGATARLYSLDPAQGQQQWVFDQAKNHYIAKPLVTDRAIYAPNADGTLYALDLNGRLLWKFSTDRSIWASPATNDTCSCIFIASMDHHLYALDAQSGTLNWKSSDLGGALTAAPEFGSDGILYIGTSGDQMMALDAETGKTLWAYSSEGWIWSGVVLQQGKLYFGDLDGYLYAVDASSGSEIWKLKTEGAILSKPLVTEDRIYYTTDTTTIGALDLDGAPLWKREMSAKVYGPIVNAGELLLVATTDLENPLIAYNVNGDIVWTFALPK